MDPDADVTSTDKPPVFNYILSFLLVGVAWGFTTPFIRKAGVEFQKRQEQQQQLSQPTELQPTRSTDEDRIGDDSESDEDQPPPPAPTTTAPQAAWMGPQSSSSSWLRTKIVSVFWTVVNLLRTPAYSVPLVINLTGSVWFFLLVGKHELSLTVPLANSSAFLFTVLGEWYVERKMIARETWVGMALVLGGIAICVQSKS
ncbi:hypothetical protein ASPSYDRAFT_91128 [Aspergillus sydowii CBS 593.65]|uniref:EamA domain-containing protein n=1 Tax=Aspergillus sydowii CBS 593.65 TaxID=1036612 RepID=A0A1L9TBN1_9EURO|nr:uncharacterized protein ASPSYDRAFT_91128 [Aspergillus sydowii CBS 593.65]OJJ56811.1 hypothetical protein ASPSYDRAFT_91128 [Aspergillus sydowii CBS 593.65]